MIIFIRGTSGSGKTTVVRKLMTELLSRRLGQFEPKYNKGRGKPLWYTLMLDPPLVILGHYESPCGGCDTIGSAAAVYDTIKLLPKTTNVIGEGLLLSEDTKWTKVLAAEGYDVRSIYLVTPVEKCIEQIKSRRASVGNEKPLNTKNTVNRVPVIERGRQKLDEVEGVTCRRASCDQSPSIILKWLGL